MIDTSVTSVPVQKETEEAEPPAEGIDDFANRALGYLASALQLSEDFCTGSPDNKSLFLFMEIDAFVRRAELAKHVDDLEFAIKDFKKVVSLCEEFPEGNQPTLISAVFCLGKCYSEL